MTAALSQVRAPRLYHGDQFEHGGRAFTVLFERDECLGAPWDEHGGHGVVSDWNTRDKAPGERVLCSDRNSRRYYDVEASLKIARRDQWGCGDDSHQHTTKRAEAACAVDRDFDYLRRWCTDQWEWLVVTVTVIEGDNAGELESLGGIDGDQDNGQYLTATAYELADQLNARLDDQDRGTVYCVACKGTGRLQAEGGANV